MKKCVSIILSLLMLISACAGSFSAYAEEKTFEYDDYTLKILDNNCTEIVSYRGSKADLDIPSILNGLTVTAIGDFAFVGNLTLSDLGIPSTVKSIGENAFANCSFLQDVKFPDSLETIGDNAFIACTYLKSVSLGKNVGKIGASAFRNCPKVTSYQVSGENKNYSSENGVLFDKNKTELLYYPAGSSNRSYTVPDGVKTIKENAFYNVKLDEITIPLSVETIENSAFEGATINKVNFYSAEDNFKNTIVQPQYNNTILNAELNHIHTVVIDEAVEPTCETPGKTEGSHCSVCGTVIKAQTEIPATGKHTPAEAVKENEVAATCTKEGSYDSVVYCSVCGKELSRETIIVPKTPHTIVIDEAVEPTCIASGKTEGSHCSVCGTVIKAQTEIPATGHKPGDPIKENEVAATCTKEGSYDSVVYCSVCGKELSRETIIVPKTPHTIVIDEAVEPTCETPGKTKGSHCSVCGAVIKAQTEIPATGHKPGDPVKENVIPATYTQAGSYDDVVYCSVCHKELSRVKKVIEITHVHTPAEAVKENEVAATCTKEGSYDSVVYCKDCGTELSREKITVSKTEHKPDSAVKENEVAATCTKEGSYDNVVYCSVCGTEISREKITVPKTEHKADSAVKENEVEATCTKEGSYDSVVYCKVCGTELSRTKVRIPVIPHTPVFIPAQKPTYFNNGKTQGRACADCGKILTAQKSVKKLKLATPSKRKAKAKKKAFTFSWKRNKNASGYIIQYSTSKKFTKKTTKQIKIKNNKTTSKTVKKLNKKKTYYIRIRAYKTSGNKTVYSSWSKAVKVKTK